MIWHRILSLRHYIFNFSTYFALGQTIEFNRVVRGGLAPQSFDIYCKAFDVVEGLLILGVESVLSEVAVDSGKSKKISATITKTTTITANFVLVLILNSL